MYYVHVNEGNTWCCSSILCFISDNSLIFILHGWHFHMQSNLIKLVTQSKTNLIKSCLWHHYFAIIMWCVHCALYTLVHTRVSDSQPIASIFHTQIKLTMLAIFKGKISYPQMYNNGPSVITLVISLLANARLA